MNAQSRVQDGGPLRLRARDAEDLQALAVHLQDALVPLADTAYLKADKRFVLVANRFRWEGAPEEVPEEASEQLAEEVSEPAGDARFEDAEVEPGTLYQRVNCGLCFDKVRGVKVRGVDLKDRRQILSLLTLTSGPGSVTLVFSGGVEIRLEVERILCHLEDLGEPWPTRWRPGHHLEEPEARGD